MSSLVDVPSACPVSEGGSARGVWVLHPASPSHPFPLCILLFQHGDLEPGNLQEHWPLGKQRPQRSLLRSERPQTEKWPWGSGLPCPRWHHTSEQDTNKV